MLLHALSETSKHDRDIGAMLEISGEDVDQDFVENEVLRLGVGEEWKKLTGQ